MATWHSRSLILGFRKTPHPPIPSFPVFNILTILTQNKTKPSFPGRHQSFNIFRSMFVYIFVYTILGYHRPILYATILFSSYSDLRSRAQLEVADPDFTSKLLLNSQLISLFPFPVLSSSDIGIVFLLNSAFWNKFWLLSDLTFWSWWQIFQLLVRIWDHYRLLRKCISSTYWWTSEDAGITHVFKNGDILLSK